MHAIVGLARALDLGIIAEGIETYEQLQLLRALGCDHGQGYFFAGPLPNPEAGELLVGTRLARDA